MITLLDFEFRNIQKIVGAWFSKIFSFVFYIFRVLTVYIDPDLSGCILFLYLLCTFRNIVTDIHDILSNKSFQGR